MATTMECPTATVLLAEYIRAADAFINATDNLRIPISDGLLKDIAALGNEREKTRAAFEDHCAEHHCRVVAEATGS